jgi:hypothetical protein
MMPRHFFAAALLAAFFAAPVIATPQPPGSPDQLHVNFVTTTGAAEPGDITFYTLGSKQFGVGRIASIVDIDGHQVMFEVLVSLEYTNGSGPFTGFVSLFWMNGDAVACRYDGVVVRDANGDSQWNSNLHVINGSGSLVGATGGGTLSGFRTASLGGSVQYTVDLTIDRHNNGEHRGGSPENADGGASGIPFGNQGDLAVDVVLTGAPEDQRLRNVGFDNSVRYGLFRIAGTDASGPTTVQVNALGTLNYRMGSGPFAGFLVLDYGAGHVLYSRYEGHTTQLSLDSTRIVGRLDVIGGTGMFDGAQGEGQVRARRGGPVGSTQLTSIRLHLQ